MAHSSDKNPDLPVLLTAEKQAAAPQFEEPIAILERAIAEHAFPGCAYGASKNGQIVKEGSLGNFTYDPQSPAVQIDTVYDVASLTKVVATTAVAMLLWQRGQLDIESLLGDILPAFVIGRKGSEWSRRVTIRHLLAHSSGLPGYVPLFPIARSSADVLRASLDLPLQAEPGSRVEYSDHGFILLGKVLERITGEDIAAFATREVFSPLVMRSTRFCPPSEDRLAIPPTQADDLYRQRRIQGEVQDEHAYLMKGISGHAGLFSNVPDLLLFTRAILTAGPDSLFHANTVEHFAKLQGPAGSSRALGWDTPSANSSSGSFFSSNSIGHLGYSGCSLWIDLRAQLAIVLLTNRTWPDRASQKIQTVRPIFHDAIYRAIYV